MLVVIRGAGDLATGVALRLWRAHIRVVMTEIPAPTAIRRTVCFSQAIVHGEATVEDMTARQAENPKQALALLKEGVIPVLADPEGKCIPVLRPDAVVDAILAKRNLGTKITDAPVVIGVGPGFTAGVDCHAVVETMRGHYLGRVIHEGSAIPNTGIPGLIGGFAGERVLRAPADGIFRQLLDIGAQVKMGDVDACPQGDEVRRHRSPVRDQALLLRQRQGPGGGRRRAGGHFESHRRTGRETVTARAAERTMYGRK